MDGYALVKTLRKQESDKGDGKHRPIIALTADVQIAQRQAYLSYGFDECLLKPVSLGQLRQLLVRWGILDESALQQKNQLTAVDAMTTAATDTDQPPAVDKAAMVAQMGAFDADAIDMLKLFIGMTEPLIEKISDASNRNDPHDLREAAHSLKGSARSAGCNPLGNVAADLQDAAERGQNPKDMVEKIRYEFERARREINSF